ncbi:Conserved_hypothetical protein [Hexamita inflata]|uniref:Uncharacterized protein n=1 Tax=Hexamita inflata TaxID=28002 RepID=A0AA86PIA9_9EUKA|nr:Conserved hypothetical protein [Hexamita inflata]
MSQQINILEMLKQTQTNGNMYQSRNVQRKEDSESSTSNVAQKSRVAQIQVLNLDYRSPYPTSKPAQVVSGPALESFEKVTYLPLQQLTEKLSNALISTNTYQAACVALRQPIQCLLYNSVTNRLNLTQFQFVNGQTFKIGTESHLAFKIQTEINANISNRILNLLQNQINTEFKYLIQLDDKILVLEIEDVPFILYHVQAIINFNKRRTNELNNEQITEFDEKQIISWAQNQKTRLLNYESVQEFTVNNLLLYFKQELVVKYPVSQTWSQFKQNQGTCVIITEIEAVQGQIQVITDQNKVKLLWEQNVTEIENIEPINQQLLIKIASDLNLDPNVYHSALQVNCADNKEIQIISHKKFISQLIYNISIQMLLIDQAPVCANVSPQTRFEEQEDIKLLFPQPSLIDQKQPVLNVQPVQTQNIMQNQVKEDTESLINDEQSELLLDSQEVSEDQYLATENIQEINENQHQYENQQVTNIQSNESKQNQMQQINVEELQESDELIPESTMPTKKDETKYIRLICADLLVLNQIPQLIKKFFKSLNLHNEVQNFLSMDFETKKGIVNFSIAYVTITTKKFCSSKIKKIPFQDFEIDRLGVKLKHKDGNYLIETDGVNQSQMVFGLSLLKEWKQ